MKKVFVCFCLFTITTGVYAQFRYDDAVYLRKGSIVRGRIVEIIPRRQLSIETPDRVVRVYQFSDIARYYKRAYPYKEAGKKPVSSRKSFPKETVQQTGTGKPAVSPALFTASKDKRSIVEGEYAQGREFRDLNYVGMDLVSGFQISRWLFLGYGLGCRYYFISSEGTPFTAYRFDADETDSLAPSIAMPFFVDWHATLLNRRVSPYLSLSLGYLFVVRRDEQLGSYGPGTGNERDEIRWGLYEGGGFIDPSMGVQYVVSGRCAVHIGMGFKVQGMRVHTREQYHGWDGSAAVYHSWYVHHLRGVISKSIVIKSGVSFRFLSGLRKE